MAEDTDSLSIFGKKNVLLRRMVQCRISGTIYYRRAFPYWRDDVQIGCPRLIDETRLSALRTDAFQKRSDKWCIFLTCPSRDGKANRLHNSALGCFIQTLIPGLWRNFHRQADSHVQARPLLEVIRPGFHAAQCEQQPVKRFSFLCVE